MIYVPANPNALTKRKKSKYRNKKVEAFGKRFDSVIERDRYFYLKDAESRGEIKNLRHQMRFEIEVKGQHICDYIADFYYEKWVSFSEPGRLYTSNVEIFVEDVKGGYKKLPVFALKEKLMKAVHGIEIRIVKSPTLPV